MGGETLASGTSSYELVALGVAAHAEKAVLEAPSAAACILHTSMHSVTTLVLMTS